MGALGVGAEGERGHLWQWGVILLGEYTVFFFLSTVELVKSPRKYYKFIL